MNIDLTSATLTVAAFLLLCGLSAWGWLCRRGLQFCRAAQASERRGLRAAIADPSFRALHRDQIHFADLCLYGAVAIIASIALQQG